MNYLEEFYSAFDEDGRLLSRHGQVEYLTTMKYIHGCLSEAKKAHILEVGAGTGRYSIALAREGHNVTAVELVESNLDKLRAKLDGSEKLTAIQGNALDLSVLADKSFDMTLVLGPMYHLYSREDMLKALREAVRVTKKGGYILAAYCMNEAAVIQHAFLHGNLQKVLENDMLTSEWHCKSEPKELFQLVRTEDIASINAELPVERIKLIAADGAANYISECIDSMDDLTFEKFMEYHFATCERQDLIGASNHTLDILRKI
ncbi:class I SAM-dependent methyltransferase [Ruminococcus flavefaciens]|uniref:class I SAM-dependent methyltransferase n=1 Tax=Ruminococcus flavefaciens TaxID=1265 RepID=UPI0013D8FC12|nr:class I SAM-dependent methyltransferase [Ruminococcus flavefaciens]